MQNKKIVFVIGAGASSEVDLPTADKLKNTISRMLDIRYEDGTHRSSGDIRVVEALGIRSRGEKSDINEYFYAARRISAAMPQESSIDNFIDTHKDDKKIELCGKLGIACSILNAERASRLYIDNSNIYNRLDFSTIEKTWYASFLKLLTKACSVENLPERLSVLTFIVFNYDRCIEHYLYNSLQNYYGLEPNQAAELTSKIKIYHPYGVVGSLPWQAGQPVSFGAQPSAGQILNSASQIKTFTEGTDYNTSQIQDIRNNIAQADTLIFLGFAFHTLNIKLMIQQPLPLKNLTCFGTAKGISDSDCMIIRDDLQQLGFDKSKLTINNKLDCFNLFEEYSRSLSFK